MKKVFLSLLCLMIFASLAHAGKDLRCQAIITGYSPTHISGSNKTFTLRGQSVRLDLDGFVFTAVSQETPSGLQLSIDDARGPVQYNVSTVAFARTGTVDMAITANVDKGKTMLSLLCEDQ